MANANYQNTWRQRVADLGMIPVLLLLCGLFSAVTLAWQYPTGAAAGRQVARAIDAELHGHGRVLIVAQEGKEDAEFANALQADLLRRGIDVAGVVRGDPAAVGEAIARLAASAPFQRIACTSVTARWSVCADAAERIPILKAVQIVEPVPYRFPNFLKTDNLLNIANQIAVIAIIAVGMTMVIITAGIDLSVGSLIALSSVVSAILIRKYAGAQQASAWGMVLCCGVGIAACAGVGLFSGAMVTIFRLPPFIVTLATMMIAKGLAERISGHQTIAEVPDRFAWLGQGADLFHIPNAVALMLLLYVAAHILMSRTALGRYIYALGGNSEAARLSGVPIRRILLLVYIVSGALAGLGGVTLASELKSGSENFGEMYELYVIAAVVVGGTSLNGGQGKIFGTLVGAFIIAVINNGMNLLGIESSNQKIVLGMVILSAVTLDQVSSRGR